MLEDYEVTIPVQLDFNGDIVSESRRSGRSKRRVSWRTFTQKNTSSDRTASEFVEPDTGVIHYKISAYGENFYLALTKTTDFMAPDFSVEHWDRTNASDIDVGSLMECHYTGHLRNMPNSRVAMSNCMGLVSVWNRWLRPGVGAP